MTAKEYVKTAQKSRVLLFEAYVEFADGDPLKACEKLWQSAAHAITAAAQQRGWEYGDLHSLYKAAKLLGEEMDDERLFLQFDVADTFRANAEYGFMEDFQLKGNRRDVRHLVERVLSLPELLPNSDAEN